MQGELFDEAGENIAEPEEKSIEAIEVPAHTRTRAKRKQLPENLPRKDIVHDIKESEKQCDCDCQKQRFGEEITEQLEVVRPKLRVIRHNVKTLNLL